jgi:hypothetical protein
MDLEKQVHFQVSFFLGSFYMIGLIQRTCSFEGTGMSPQIRHVFFALAVTMRIGGICSSTVCSALEFGIIYKFLGNLERLLRYLLLQRMVSRVLASLKWSF